MTSIGPLGANLQALSTRFCTARSSALGRPSTNDSSALHHHVAPEAAAGAVGCPVGDVDQTHRLHRLVVAGFGGQLDQLVDQVGELAGLAVEVGEQLLASVRRQLLEAAAQHRDVGAQAGERRAQLVAGVLHQLVLLVLAALQRLQHAGEGAAQLARLVGAVDRHLDVEPAGAGNHAGGGRSGASGGG